MRAAGGALWPPLLSRRIGLMSEMTWRFAARAARPGRCWGTSTSARGGPPVIEPVGATREVAAELSVGTGAGGVVELSVGTGAGEAAAELSAGTGAGGVVELSVRTGAWEAAVELSAGPGAAAGPALRCSLVAAGREEAELSVETGAVRLVGVAALSERTDAGVGDAAELSVGTGVAAGPVLCCSLDSGVREAGPGLAATVLVGDWGLSAGVGLAAGATPRVRSRASRLVLARSHSSRTAAWSAASKTPPSRSM
jgi:hypothetical protein